MAFPILLSTILAAASALKVVPTNSHRELYNVEVNFELQDLDEKAGITMVFAKNQHSMRLDSGLNTKEGLAWGRFDDQIPTTGWSKLVVETSETSDWSNDAKVYSAGFVEGLMTSVRISEQYSNTYRLFDERQLSVLKTVFHKELDNLRQKTNLVSHVLTVEPPDAYWKQARYVLVQLWGICDGYNHIARQTKVATLSLEDMLLLNAGAEIPVLLNAFAFKIGGAPTEVNLQRRGSALVRLAHGNSDIFVGHTTWEDYSKMIRIFKYYKFSLSGAETIATSVAFSSYPGAVSSTDDFYLMDSGISVMETSLEIINPTAYNAMRDLSQERIPCFVHVMAVNRLATSAEHWVHLVRNEGPAIYAAQWMVVDYNRFKAGSEVPDETFYVAEVLPGLHHSEDLSAVLRSKGYWPSTNRPYFVDVRAATGHAAEQLRLVADPIKANAFSWEANSRALMLEKGALVIQDLSQMGLLMNQNTFPQTGSVAGGPGNEVSARMELETIGARPRGGIDAKVAGRCSLNSLTLQVISGPSHANQAPFSWLDAQGQERWPGWPHTGLPDLWNFGFVQMDPRWISDQLSTMQQC
jgi:hypothetical protein